MGCRAASCVRGEGETVERDVIARYVISLGFSRFIMEQKYLHIFIDIVTLTFECAM